MNSPPSVVDSAGRSVPLQPQFASGGEGAVFRLANDPKLVAKLYHQPPTDQTAAKLTAMTGLANPRLLSMTAWPQQLLYQHRTRKLAGFVMPFVADSQPIQQLYNPIQRLKVFPRQGWDFQVHAALNLAAVFDEVHRAGCLVGDINQSNVQVSSTALVHLIDCDSFQVQVGGKAFLCEVGVPHYTPPELQGKSFRGLTRTENHDRFGLAVLLYQLLFVGRHPYAGIYQGSDEPSFEELIAKFRFAQGPLAQSWGMAPPPHTPNWADIPPELGTLFRRSFERGGETGTRPRPADWHSALRRLESEMKTCPADSGHKYWRGAKSCVWCRLAERGGPEYYFGVADGSATFTVNEAKLAEVLRRLAAIQPVDIPFEKYHKRFTPLNPRRPNPVPQDLKENRLFTTVLLALTALFLLAIPLGLFSRFIGSTGFLGTLVFGIWLAIHLHVSPWHREWRRRRLYFSQVLARLNRLEADWQEILGRYRRQHVELSETIRGKVAECRGLTQPYHAELSRLTTQAEAASRLRHLRLHLLADADIPKIGSGRKQALAASNIYTAADINETVIRNLKGFGDTLTANLLAWKQEVLLEFRFDPRSAISPAERQALTVRFRNRHEQILADLNQELAKFESLQPECREAIQILIPNLKKAIIELEQARADLMVFEDKTEIR